MLVADSGPLISLARAGLFPLVQRVLGEIIVSDAVYCEIVVKGERQPGALEVRDADWIAVKSIRRKGKIKEMGLGAGEAEAILLAEEQKATLLIDDPVGRRVARERGLKYFGSLEILLRAKRQGYLTSIKEALDKLVATGFYISEELYREVLHKAGED
jgi:hypothetical protein